MTSKSQYQDDYYSAWLKYSNQRVVLQKFLRDHFGEWCAKNPISLLELGCGFGSFARELFTVLDEKKISYQYTGADPYKEQLGRWGELGKNSTITLIQKSIDEFSSEKKFDTVFAIHCLYYVNDLRASLQKIFSLGKNAMIVHHGEKGIDEIHRAFRRYVKPGPNIISTYKDIQNELDSLGIRYKLYDMQAEVDLRPCHDPQNSDGRKLIKFFLEDPELPENVIEEVSAFLKKKGDTMELSHGYFLINGAYRELMPRAFT